MPGSPPKPSADSNVPTHVAVIMDGNGRWARNRGLPRHAGHRSGVGAVRRTVETAAEKGIRYLTLFAFSSCIAIT
jgi:undecaprenyl diphosphate synthase